MSTTTVDRYAGVDVSKARLDVAVRPTGERYSVANDPEGIDTLLGRLEEAGPPELVVLEATGGFERPAAMALATSGIPVAVVNPRQARDFAKATGTLAKTDRIDAYVLARFAEALKPEPRALPDQQALLLSEILDRRRQLIGMLVDLRTTVSRRPSPLRSRSAFEPTSGGLRRSSPAPTGSSKRPSRRAPPGVRMRPSCAASPASDRRSGAPSWQSFPSWGLSPTSASVPWWASLPSTATPEG
jgi:hypothetical protein